MLSMALVGTVQALLVAALAGCKRHVQYASSLRVKGKGQRPKAERMY
jgi:hypothetical protein